MSHSLVPPTLRRRPVGAGLTLAAFAAAAYPLAAQTQAPAQAPIETPPVVVEGGGGSANPNADPAAPLKVDRSANPKLPLPLLDTPRSVTAITKEQIKESGASSLRDVLRQQPGITLGTGEGGNAFGDRVFIRGFDARNDIFIDGLRDPGVTARESFAIEQIEVLKGPSATIGGRGTTGGAVDIVSKTPRLTNFHEMDVTLGTDMTKRVAIDVNRAIDERFAIRVNGLVHDADVAGRDEVFDKRYGFAIAGEYKPNQDWSIILDYYKLRTDALPDWGIPYDTRANAPFAVPRDRFYGVTGRDYWETWADILTAKVSGLLTPTLKLDVRARYGVTRNAYVVSAPEGVNLVAGTVNANAKTRDQKNVAAVLQTSLTYNFNDGLVGRHTLIGGVEVSRETAFNRPPSVNPRGVTQSIFAPNPDAPWTGQVGIGSSIVDTTIDSKSIYLLDTIRLSPQWIATLGVRYDTFDIGVYSGPGDYVANATRVFYDKGFVNWNAALTYKPLPYASIYAAVATSSNPPGEQVDGGAAAGYGGLTSDYQNFQPESNTLYEIGTKWSLFDEHLTLTAAAFWIEKEGLLNSASVGGVTRSDDGGAARVRGVEIGVVGNITPAWSVAGGAVLMESEVTKNPLQPTTVGQPLANGAERSLAAQTKYQLTDALAIGGAATYRSEVRGGTLAATTTRIPSYWRFDLSGQYKLNENATLRLNVLNLFDATYFDTLYRSGAPFVYVAPGRSALLTLSVTY